MKNSYKFLALAVIAFIMAGTMSCSQQNRDKTIKADLATKAKSEKDFAGLSFTVEDGIVTLNGKCASENSKNIVYSKVKGLYGVKNVVDNIQIGPVTIGTDELLKQGVDSILKEYASVEAITKDSIVYLKGKVENKELKTLTRAIHTLKPRMVENGLTVK